MIPDCVLTLLREVDRLERRVSSCLDDGRVGTYTRASLSVLLDALRLVQRSRVAILLEGQDGETEKAP